MVLAERVVHLSAKIQRWMPGEILRNLGRYSLGTSAAQFLMMIYTLLVARTLGPDQFGRFSGSYALAGLTIFFVNWGMDTLLLREAGSLAAPRAWAGRVLRNKLVLGLIWGVTLVIIAPLIRPDVFTPALMLVCILDVWFDHAMTSVIGGLNIQKRFRSVSWIIFLSRVARLLGALAIALVGGAGPFVYALARGIATAGGFLISAWVLKPDLAAPGTPSGRQVWRHSIPYGVSDFLALIYLQADVFLLTLMAGSLAAGLYSPASGLVNALFVIPSTVFLVTVPVLARQRLDAPQRLHNSLLRLTLGYLGLGLALSLGVALLGGWALRLLLGPKYLLTSVLLGMLSPLLLFKCLGFGWAAFLVSVGWYKQRLIPQAISAAFNVLVNIWAIPRLGIPGVALVYVVTELILALGYGGLVLKWLREEKK